MAVCKRFKFLLANLNMPLVFRHVDQGFGVAGGADFGFREVLGCTLRCSAFNILSPRPLGPPRSLQKNVLA